MVILIKGRYKEIESTPYCTELRKHMVNGCIHMILFLSSLISLKIHLIALIKIAGGILHRYGSVLNGRIGPSYP